MYFNLKLIVILSCLLHSYHASDDSTCGEHNRLIFRSPGNITLTGIFNIHGGENCSTPLESGTEQAASAIWTTSMLNQHNYISGVEIGLAIFDGCNDKDEVQKSFVQSLIMENCIKTESTIIGTFTTEEIQKTLEPLANGLNQTLNTIGAIVDSSSALKMASDLLREMSIMTVHRVIADSQAVLDDFGRKMSQEGICVYDQTLIFDLNASINEVLQPEIRDENDFLISDPPVIVILASSSNIYKFFDHLEGPVSNSSDITWILIPSDSVLDNTDRFSNNTFVLSAVLPKPERLQLFFSQPQVTADVMNHRDPTKSPLFFSTTTTIIDLLSPLKNILTFHCQDQNDSCPELDKQLTDISSGKSSKLKTESKILSVQDIEKVLTTLKIPINEEMLLFNVRKKSRSDDVAVFQLYDERFKSIHPVLLLIMDRRRRSIVRLGIEDIQNRGKSKEVTSTVVPRSTEMAFIRKEQEKHPCYAENGTMSSDCGVCLNFVKFLSRVAQEHPVSEQNLEILWRFETWVTVNASVAAIGIICTLAIFIFISARICMGDVLEGSPALSFFLLFALIIAYACSLPFSFYTKGTIGDQTISSLICDLRMAGPPLSYSILFSILFSRSLMLAASDQDGGFMSHVNGYLQAVIVFFVSAVQFAISGLYWIYNSFLNNPQPSCQAMYESHIFMYLLAYDLFLLILLMTLIPFIFRTKRNYKEGTVFSIAFVCIFLLWGSWIPLFYLLDDQYRDATVLLGLTGTSTIIVVCVFIPRTYLMTTAIVRDRIVNTLPPLNQSDFRSTQALYDTLKMTGNIGTQNPNFYSVNPSEGAHSSPAIRPGEYYSTDLGKIPPNLKTENACNDDGRRTPDELDDAVYQRFDSPALSPNHNVTRF